MTISVLDFPKCEKLILKRKLLLEFAACVDPSDFVEVMVRGQGKSGLFDHPWLFVEDVECAKKIKELVFSECQRQIAKLEIEIAAFGVSLDA